MNAVLAFLDPLRWKQRTKPCIYRALPRIDDPK
jgi:hypothetical protein